MTDCPSGNFIGQVRFALCCWFRQKWCLIVLDWWFVDVFAELFVICGLVVNCHVVPGLTLDCQTVDGSEIGRMALADSSPDETSGRSP